MNTNTASESPIPKLAIVIIVYNMQREAPRTLYSLSPSYQRNADPADYEVIVVENGSREPLLEEQVRCFGNNFGYLQITNAEPSPAAAINLGVSKTTSDYVAVMIDGARIASPGIIGLALSALNGFPRAVVGTAGFHLGPDVQPRSVVQGYGPQVEDELLAGIAWRQNGYRLFEISTPAMSSPVSWLDGYSESNLTFLPRELFEELNGYDERFDLPGGGLVNLDFYRRASELENSTLINLFGEGTFHQVHGGVMTNRPESELKNEMEIYQRQYKEIHGRKFRRFQKVPMLIGFPNPSIVPGLRKACDLYLEQRSQR